MNPNNYHSESITSIAPALMQAQYDLESASKESQAHKYKYADLCSVWAVAREPLKKNGLCFTSSVVYQDGAPYLRSMLIHTSGEYFMSYVPLLMGKQDMQALGSAITYARRYSLSSMLGVMADDDDGKKACEPETAPKAVQPKMINLDQIKELTMLIQSFEKPENVYTWIYTKTNVDSISKLTESQFFNIIAGLKKG
jgi:hypothetical protein